MGGTMIIGKIKFLITLNFPRKGHATTVMAFSPSHAAKQFAIRYFEKYPKLTYIEFSVIPPVILSNDVLRYDSSRSLDGDIKTELMI